MSQPGLERSLNPGLGSLDLGTCERIGRHHGIWCDAPAPQPDWACGCKEREPDRGMVDRSEGLGERLLGVLLDRAHEMPLREPTSVAAEIQWSLPPLACTWP